MVIGIFVEIDAQDAGRQLELVSDYADKLEKVGFATYLSPALKYASLDEAECDMEGK